MADVHDVLPGEAKQEGKVFSLYGLSITGQRHYVATDGPHPVLFEQNH